MCSVREPVRVITLSDEHVEFPTMVEHTPNEKLSLESPPPSYISSPKDDEKPMSFADFDRKDAMQKV